MVNVTMPNYEIEFQVDGMTNSVLEACIEQDEQLKEFENVEVLWVNVISDLFYYSVAHDLTSRTFHHRTVAIVMKSQSHGAWERFDVR